jgi:hypothetical protein
LVRLAVHRGGKIGFLTNIYTGVAVQGEGRGFLVTDYVSSSGTDSMKRVSLVI